MKKKEGKEQNVKDMIGKAAYALLGEKGYANVSTRDIAKKANVALSQLNYYFKTKEKLYLEIIDICINKIVSETKTKLSVAKKRSENFKLLVDYFKDLVKNDPELFKLLFDFMSQSLFNNGIKAHISGLFKDLKDIITKCVIKPKDKQDTFKGLNVDYLSGMVVYNILGFSINSVFGGTDIANTDTTLLTNLLFGNKFRLTD